LTAKLTGKAGFAAPQRFTVEVFLFTFSCIFLKARLASRTRRYGMPINPAFLGHGIFLELAPINGIRRYANYKKPIPPDSSMKVLVDKFIEAVTDMDMSSVWFELFTRSGTIDEDGKLGTKELVEGLKAAKISAVPWGYCFGKNSEHPDPKDNDLQRAIDLCDQYELNVFVADIEPWNEIGGIVDKWKADALSALVTGLNAHFKKDNLGISSFASLAAQPKAREYLKPVTPLVSFCAPQIYWNKRDPIPWARESLQSWRDAGITTELVATVQSYWEKNDNTGSQTEMEDKVRDFVAHFPASEWSKLIGLNWYHAGDKNTADKGGMSDPMINAIIAAKLNKKPYKKAYEA
jgi:hypothetical protein